MEISSVYAIASRCVNVLITLSKQEKKKKKLNTHTHKTTANIHTPHSNMASG